MNTMEADSRVYEMSIEGAQGLLTDDVRNCSSKEYAYYSCDNATFRCKVSNEFYDSSTVTFSDDTENSTTGPVTASRSGFSGSYDHVPANSFDMSTNDTDWNDLSMSMSEELESVDVSHFTMPQLEEFERILQAVLSQDICDPEEYPFVDIDLSSEDSTSGGASDEEMFAGRHDPGYDESMVDALDPDDHHILDHIACHTNVINDSLDRKPLASLALPDSNQDSETCSLERGLEIVKSLKECASAVAEGDFMAAAWLSEHLQGIMSLKGNSMERVAKYFNAALRAKLGIEDDRASLASALTSSKIDMASLAYQSFYRWCPYLMFSHFTANQAILEAFEGEENIHIVDLDVKQGLQWPSLFQALSELPNGPPMISITVVVGAAPDLSSVMATRERLLKFADALSVPLSYHIVQADVENLEPGMLQIRPGEALAVNSVSSFHQLTAHPSTSIRNFLRVIGNLRPSLVIIVEQDSNQEWEFLPRFNCALHYYCSMFDSVAASGLGRLLEEREMVEKFLLAEDIMTIVGEKEQDRSPIHRSASFWIQSMAELGFRIRPASAWSVRQAMTLLLARYPDSKYSLFHENGSLSLGWQEKPLYWVLSWHGNLK